MPGPLPGVGSSRVLRQRVIFVISTHTRRIDLFTRFPVTVLLTKEGNEMGFMRIFSAAHFPPIVGVLFLFNYVQTVKAPVEVLNRPRTPVQVRFSTLSSSGLTEYKYLSVLYLSS